MQKMALVIDQRNIKDNMRQCYQGIIQKYDTTYILISSKILFLII